jgi:hypothetical protein
MATEPKQGIKQELKLSDLRIPPFKIAAPPRHKDALPELWELLLPFVKRGKTKIKSPADIDPAKTEYTVNEVAALTGWSRDTIIRRFANERGVRVEGNAETIKGRRRYRELRIPKSVLTRILTKKTNK